MDKIVRLALSGELIASPDQLGGSYTSVDSLLAEVKAPSIILLDGLKPGDINGLKETFHVLYHLRRPAAFYAAPVYFAKSMGNLDAFADGIGSTWQEIYPHAKEILAKIGSADAKKTADNPDLRLLAFLYCRGDSFALAPLALAASPWIYEYPVALLVGDCFDAIAQQTFCFGAIADKFAFKGTLKSSAEWLADLCAQGFLTANELVDRIRLCPYCQTGNLNYIDSCPICGSIDFAKKKMIHCFTCGHVAPDENFKNGMMYVCPRCNAALRHIGSDYDRPVESHLCNTCGQRFIDPDVKAECLHCRKKSAPQDLLIRQLYNYSLSAKGKRAVVTGNMDFAFSLFDANRNVIPAYFYQATDWFLQMKTRYSDEDFSLLCIKLEGLEIVENLVGITRLRKLIDEIAIRIRELVRVTDITTSTGANTFWLLLPRTNKEGGELLASRIAKLADLVSLENGEHITIRALCFSIPVEYAKRGPVAELLISEYEASTENAG